MKTLRIHALLLILLLAFSASGQENLSLKESRKLALEYNHAIKIANSLILENKANEKFAFTHFLPNLKGEGSYVRLFDIDDITMAGTFLPTANSMEDALMGKFSGISNVYFPGMKIEMGDLDFYTANINLLQPIYAGGKIRRGYKMAKIGSEMAVLNLKLKKSDIILETDKAYWNLVSVREKVKMADIYVKMLQSVVRDLQNAFDLELVTKNDLLKAKVQLNKAKLGQFKAKNGYVLSRMALCQVIGKPLDTEIIPTDTILAVQVHAASADFKSKALQQRAELQLLSKQVDLSKQQEKFIMGNYMPQLGVGASYGYTSKVKELMKENTGFRLQAKVTMPIFHWNERKHKRSIARAKTAQKELALQQAKDLIGLQVQQAYFRLQEANEQIRLADVTMQQAEENVTIARNSFTEGLISTSELLDAQALWQQAFSDLIDAKINYKLQEVEFKKAIGELVVK